MKNVPVPQERCDIFICLPHATDTFSGTVNMVKFSAWLHSNPHNPVLVPGVGVTK